MSIARHHAEWLSLTEISGPFLSMPVLQRVFPQGLEAHDPEHRKELQLAYEEWQESNEVVVSDSGLQYAWIRFVLRESLGCTPEVLVEGQALPSDLQASLSLHAETLRPDLALLNPPDMPEPGKARLLVVVYPVSQDLEQPVAGRRWSASPATRMMELCRATGVALGLATNGERWMLVHAPRGETTGYASWYASLWIEEPLTLRAFRSLLSARRFFGVAAAETLEALYTQSVADQQEVTDQLGLQVLRAVEVLVQAIDRIDKDRGRALLVGIVDAKARQVGPIYSAALTVMMRLVFLFSAEERKLLLLGDPVYDENYAVSTLRAQLREAADRHGEEVLERRHDAWSRLLATFRAVHGGLRHDRLSLPAYGGDLFDPDRYPFLEGRRPGSTWRETPAVPLPIHNRTVLHLLEALQILQVRVPGGGPAEARLLSFRALGIEQIGHVYEGLLDHGAVRADEPILGLAGAKGQEPEVPLSKLEALWPSPTALAPGKKEPSADVAPPASLIEFLKEETGRSESALRKALAAEVDERRLLVACDNDESLALRVRPFAGLLRKDSSGYPLVITSGSVYVTQVGERRSTGTHYTPPSLTEPIVQHTLDPLVYAGMSDGVPPSPETLRTPAEILDLKVCDFACGSGAFLVQACRYLADKLIEAWKREEERGSTSMRGQTPDAAGVARVSPWARPSRGGPQERLLPSDPYERLLHARRLVADRCLYGVDKNPQAVEMAKLSLWLTTVQRERPFTFLDHALRTGDSLLGLVRAEQLIAFDLNPASHRAQELKLFKLDELCHAALQLAVGKRRKLESFTVETVRDADLKRGLLAEADEALARLRVLADLIVAGALATAGRKPSADEQNRWDHVLHEVIRVLQPTTSEEARTHLWEWLRQTARERLGERRPFHWFLEFSEVFLGGERRGPHPSSMGSAPLIDGVRTSQRGGPNLSWMGSDSIGEEVQPPHRGGPHPSSMGSESIPGVVQPPHGGAPAGFDAIIGNPPFQAGSKITGTLGTDYRIYLVEQVAHGQRGNADLSAYFFLRADKLVRDGGNFGLIATNTIAQGDTREVGLDSLMKAGISIFRAVPSRKWPGEANLEIAEVWLKRGIWKAVHVLEDRPVSGITSLLSVPGKVEGKPYRLKANDGKSFTGNKVYGEGFVLTPEEARALIEKDPRNREVLFPYLNGEDLNSTFDQSPTRWVINFADRSLEEARAYPDVLNIVERLVRPYRETVNREHTRKNWWLHEHDRPELYATIAEMERVLVKAQVSKYHMFVLARTNAVYDQRLVCTALFDFDLFSILQCSFHDEWGFFHGSTLETRPTYTPTTCFETFPFPLAAHSSQLATIGQTYHAHRQAIMLGCGEGLTKTYNRFHNPGERAADIVRLQELHVEMDNAVRDAYGWTDLELGHGFHETKQGMRFTISEAARREVLDRLLALNHERYADEVLRGLHEKGGKGKKTGPQKPKATRALPKEMDSPSPGAKAAPKAQPLNLFDTEPDPSPNSLPPPENPPVAWTPPSIDTSAPERLLDDQLEPIAPETAEPVDEPDPLAISPAPTTNPAATSPPLADPGLAVLDLLRSSGKPLSKSEILAGAQVPEAGWQKLVARLLAENKIVQEGQKRGTRYALAAANGSSGETPS